MKVKMILPSLIDENSPYWRTIPYARFPPLGLATLAGYLSEEDEITIEDEHVQYINFDDEPDLVVIQTYITNAYRSYAIADHFRKKNAYVVMGGLHVTSLPAEASQHADTIFLGPGEDTWPQFLNDYHAGNPQKVYHSCVRSLSGMPQIRRDLIQTQKYLVPNSLVVSRGCPHHCDFCYKDNFYEGGKSFYTMPIDEIIAEIERLPGRYLFFLDDNILGDVKFASELFDRMKGMNRVWQAAGTVSAVMNTKLLEKAVSAGLRSLFVGFETLSSNNLKDHKKNQNLHRSYEEAIHRLHSMDVMVNGSFVFGMDHDDETVFDRTVDWTLKNGIETASFHILTPYPGTPLYDQMKKQGRILHSNWSLYDTKHVVFKPARMSPITLEEGFMKAYNRYFRWNSILEGSLNHDSLRKTLRHFAYTVGWKKCDPLWNFLIRHERLQTMVPLLEFLLKKGNGLKEPLKIQSNPGEKRLQTMKKVNVSEPLSSNF